MRVWIRVVVLLALLGSPLGVAGRAEASALLHARPPRIRFLPLAVVRALVDRYAARYGIPLELARRLVTVESGWRQDAVSRRGARGIMQLRPMTARGLRVNIHDVEQNIEGGMRYLRQQYDRFARWDLALAAYHSGPAKVARYRGVPPASRRYVQLVLGNRSYPPPGRAAAARPAAKPKPAAGIPVILPVPREVPEPPLVVWRRATAWTGESWVTAIETVERGAVTGRAMEIRITDGDGRIWIRREFRLAGGGWTLAAQRVVTRAADGTVVEEGETY